MNAPPIRQTRERRPRLLVVDDVVPMREALTKLLTLAGYEVEAAANVREVMQLLALVRWDGVVLDIDRPEMNGVELYARILHAYGEVRLPVIFLSCHPNELLRFGLEAAPWARLVQKPCVFAEVLKALESCLEHDQGTNRLSSG